jgi:wobble nucleotide-excising tRNase
MHVLLDRIAEIIGGVVIYSNDRYYIKREDIGNVGFDFEAEGYKKLGLIYRLIETGQIKKGSILLWDEPDANLNPKLIPLLVDILLILEQAGVQVFLATHDYFLAKYLDVRKTNSNCVKYHSLYKSNGVIKCEHEMDFESLANNSIITQSISLYEEEVKKVME